MTRTPCAEIDRLDMLRIVNASFARLATSLVADEGVSSSDLPSVGAPERSVTTDPTDEKGARSDER